MPWIETSSAAAARPRGEVVIAVVSAAGLYALGAALIEIGRAHV